MTQSRYHAHVQCLKEAPWYRKMFCVCRREKRTDRDESGSAEGSRPRWLRPKRMKESSSSHKLPCPVRSTRNRAELLREQHKEAKAKLAAAKEENLAAKQRMGVPPEISTPNRSPKTDEAIHVMSKSLVKIEDTTSIETVSEKIKDTASVETVLKLVTEARKFKLEEMRINSDLIKHLADKGALLEYAVLEASTEKMVDLTNLMKYKSDNDASVMKWKSDNDASVMKWKSDNDASVMKNKSDNDASVVKHKSNNDASVVKHNHASDNDVLKHVSDNELEEHRLEIAKSPSESRKRSAIYELRTDSIDSKKTKRYEDLRPDSYRERPALMETQKVENWNDSLERELERGNELLRKIDLANEKVSIRQREQVELQREQVELQRGKVELQRENVKLKQQLEAVEAELLILKMKYER